MENTINQINETDPEELTEEEKIRMMADAWSAEQKRQVEEFLIRAAGLPGIRVDRVKFLHNLLKKNYPDETWTAIGSTPAEAGLSPETLDKLADQVIRTETAGLCGISAATGIPKGWLILISLPADIAQYYAHMLRLVQKLDYIYGHRELSFENGKATEETRQRLLLLTGVMYGQTDAKGTISTISNAVSAKVQSKANGKMKKKVLTAKPLQKATEFINEKVPFGKLITSTEAKYLPIGKMLASGVVSYTAFRNMAKRLKWYLSSTEEDEK